jgi:hypothetical protein
MNRHPAVKVPRCLCVSAPLFALSFAPELGSFRPQKSLRKNRSAATRP